MGVGIPKNENTELITLERVCDLSRKRTCIQVDGD